MRPVLIQWSVSCVGVTLIRSVSYCAVIVNKVYKTNPHTLNELKENIQTRRRTSACEQQFFEKVWNVHNKEMDSTYSIFCEQGEYQIMMCKIYLNFNYLTSWTLRFPPGLLGARRVTSDSPGWRRISVTGWARRTVYIYIYIYISFLPSGIKGEWDVSDYGSNKRRGTIVAP